MWLCLSAREKLAYVLITLLYVAIGSVMVRSISALVIERYMVEATSALNSELTLVRSRLEAAIFRDSYLADSLATVVTIDPVFAVSNWETIAATLLDRSTYVRNVGLAPNNIITHVYPVAGNEAAIGFDFRTRPEQLATVLKAKALQTMYIAGPVNLVQGGTAIIARYPIFSDSPFNQQYWGGISVVLRYDKLLQDSGVGDFSFGDIALRKRHSDDEPWNVFYGDADVFEHANAHQPVQLPSGQWEIAAHFDISNSPSVRNRALLVHLIGGITLLLMYLVVYLLYRNYQYAHRESMQDELTLLPNRRFMLRKLEQLFAHQEKPRRFAILNIDLDDFKRVNDQLGHEAGDALLKHIADHLAESVRSRDIVCRFGGDEFLVLLSDVDDAKQVEKIQRKLQKIIRSHPLRWQQHIIVPSISIGQALVDQHTINDLLAQADREMYSHKHQQQKGTLIMDASFTTEPSATD
ncbi:sensor domain-containing diguanylate cyclase [Bacterioplanes sanyensis]|uniref:Sensor domain-containing diguanylate cyclase n=1 Tax=Bacterioplanes sanyensis TaxID=1249553 RepID=A0A222FNY9_9GAMM|nr:diguanylate cyclase [Bacterioplanes sanyensis]ASP39933.1 sensor domain-containing diguanylate cyclase [Bacterioplanes sanyensis]